MDFKRIMLWLFIACATLNCYANNRNELPKEWNKWISKLEKDGNMMYAFSVQRGWALYGQRGEAVLSDDSTCISIGDHYRIHSFKKNKDWELPFYAPPYWLCNQNTVALLHHRPINVDTCRSELELYLDGPTVHYPYYTFSRDGRAIFYEISTHPYHKDVMISLETGKRHALFYEDLLGQDIDFSDRGRSWDFDSDSTFYFYEPIYCNRAGKDVNNEILHVIPKRLEKKYGQNYEWDIIMSNIQNHGNRYKLYYRKVRYNTKGKRIWTGKLMSLSKIMAERDITPHDIYGSESDNQKKIWGEDGKITREMVYDSDSTSYQWEPVMCSRNGLVMDKNTSEAQCTDSLNVADNTDVQRMLQTEKPHWMFRRQRYVYRDEYGFDQVSLGYDPKLYTREEVLAIEQKNFQWPDEWTTP